MVVGEHGDERRGGGSPIVDLPDISMGFPVPLGLELREKVWARDVV